MAIINRTPDSFYDRGATYADDAGLTAIDQAVADGADIVDIGGVKGGAGPDISVEEEIRRVVDFVSAARERQPNVLISVDTYRAQVAERVCQAGADLLNDAWSGTDPELAGVAAKYGVGLVCSHTGGVVPRTDPHRAAFHPDVVADVIRTVTSLAQRAVDRGVRADGILIDPTHDFGKSTAHSLELTRRIDEMVATGWPVLIAVSNKDFIGETLDAPPGQRESGTVAALTYSAWNGARVFRVHDVRAARQALSMVSAIRSSDSA